MRVLLARIAPLALGLLQLALAVALAAYLASFAVHAWLLLTYPYPLDYGEGPLLAQIERLRAGTPIWRLYGDPQAAPYIVVNYPPLYPLLVAGLSWLTGSALSAGRLLSLLAALGCVVALALLCLPRPAPNAARVAPVNALRAWFIALLFLSIPIVREWAVLLRVDILGVALGLAGLLALRRALRAGSWRWALLAGLLLLLTLYVKPSLIAAPAAGGAWLTWVALHDPGLRRAALRCGLLALAVLGGGGGLLFALLHWASGGWFALHVVTANANRWEADLARQFWLDQARLRWPLALAALLGGLAALRARPGVEARDAQYVALPLFYALLGVVTAIGVGKVGAYSNYFLELYAGLIWLVGLALQPEHSPRAGSVLRGGMQRAALGGLLLASLLYYPPLWSETLLRQAGQVEPLPPRLAFGRYGLWRDLQREAEVLAAQARVQAALTAEVRAAGPLIFTDMPGVAAAAGALARVQIFEQRQLIDQGEWDQRPLLHELANGTPPLAVIDFLGNWLTPEMITLIERRYAQDGSLGDFDLYRPVAPGPRRAVDLRFPADGAELRLSGYHLAPPPGAAYEPGALLLVTLEWQTMPPAAPAAGQELSVVVQLTDGAGRALLESERPLLYGVLPPADWPAATAVQHMQPVALPAELPSRAYSLALTLRAAGRDVAPPRVFAQISVAADGGRTFDETGYFVPAPLLRAWEDLGGVARAGYPLTPVVPFNWGALQCFERVCLELRDGAVQQRPLGERLYLAETRRSAACWPDGAPAPADAPCPAFHAAWLAHGGAANLGPPISGEIERNGYIVQWTRYARLERHRDAAPGEDGEVGLGRLGADGLRLPPGTPYRWP